MKYENNIPVFGPGFFDSFQCIADACPMTCCREWIIPVDDRTLHRWEKTSLDGQTLIRSTERGEDGRHRIRLQPDHRCPWLDERGLCRIVLTHGDGMLSSTCASFPRQVRRYEDRIERTLLTGCPAVLELLLAGDPVDMGEPETDPAAEELVNEDDRMTMPALRLVRKYAASILMDETLSPEEAMQTVFELLRDLWEYEAEPDRVEETLAVMADPGRYRSMAVRGRSAAAPADSLRERNELFLDLCENYHREGKYPEILPELVAAAKDLDPEEPVSSEDCRMHDPMLRKAAACDCMTGLLSAESDLTELLVNYQWILLRFAGIRHALRLWGAKDPETGKKILCVLERMTGFSDADIRETMKTMFDEVLWDKGYVRLLLG